MQGTLPLQCCSTAHWLTCCHSHKAKARKAEHTGNRAACIVYGLLGRLQDTTAAGIIRKQHC